MRRGALGLFLLSVAVAAAAPQRIASSPARAHLIELYTSEGCSSCPPAEAWLGNLRTAPGLWRDFVPVAFHVDYWDRLGWPDRFARREHTRRQQAYAAAWRMDRVYTPEFVLNGREWRIQTRREAPLAGKASGTLQAEIEGGRVSVDWQPVDPGDLAVELHVALLGGGFVSAIKAGENRGETLVHEFVVLTLTRHAMREGRAEFAMPQAEVAGGTRRALALWVTRRDAFVPLQATGGWLE